MNNHASMLRLPVIEGLIKRRLLINFRADPAVVQRILPEGFQPKLHRGHAIVGICLIRLEQIRPKGVPAILGISSENAAHRIAVEWAENGVRREGVFIPRRDTDSTINALAGGRVFPGEHHHSQFRVKDDGAAVSLAMSSADETASVRVECRAADSLPKTSCFDSLEEASAYFEPGCVGYSVTSDPDRLDGIELKTAYWQVQPVEVTAVQSSFFQDGKCFPADSIQFDRGLIMRDIPHEWHGVPDYRQKSDSEDYRPRQTTS